MVPYNCEFYARFVKKFNLLCIKFHTALFIASRQACPFGNNTVVFYFPEPNCLMSWIIYQVLDV